MLISLSLVVLQVNESPAKIPTSPSANTRAPQTLSGPAHSTHIKTAGVAHLCTRCPLVHDARRYCVTDTSQSRRVTVRVLARAYDVTLTLTKLF